MAQNSTGPVTQTRRSSGHPWPKGVSGNPGGRPQGLGILIRERTKDGEAIVDFMVSVFEGKVNGKRSRLRDRMEAAAWLSDHGWGKPVQAILHGGDLGLQVTDARPLQAFTTDELRKLLVVFDQQEQAAALLALAAPGKGGDAAKRQAGAP